jgi:hypothetical protein
MRAAHGACLTTVGGTNCAQNFFKKKQKRPEPDLNPPASARPGFAEHPGAKKLFRFPARVILFPI